MRDLPHVSTDDPQTAHKLFTRLQPRLWISCW